MKFLSNMGQTNDLGMLRTGLRLFILGFWVLAGFSNVQAEDCVQSGKEHLKAQRFTDALLSFDRCKQANEADAGAYFYSGIALAATGNFKEAVVELGQSVGLAPDNAEYALGFADILSSVGQWAPAKEILGLFDQEDKLHQLDTEQLWLLSELYYKAEDFEQSLELLDWVAAKIPEDPRIDFRRGQIYMDSSSLEEALVHFRKAIEGMPDMGAPFFGVGVILRLQNKLEEAKQAIVEAVKLEPENIEFLWQLAEVCLGLNQPEEAVEYLVRIEKADDSFLEAYRLLGDSYRRLGDQTLAQAYLDKFQSLQASQQAAEAFNEDIQSAIARGEEKLQENEIDEAQELFQEVVEKAPDNWLAHSYLAKIYLSSGYSRFAYSHLSKMEKLDPESVEGNYLLGQYWYQRRDFRQAQLYTAKAKNRYPGSGVLRNLLGNIYVEIGQPKKAIEEYEAAVRLEPDRPDFRRNYEAILRNQ